MGDILKPCPFCGSDEIFVYLKSTNYDKWCAVCEICLARGGIGETKEEAATLWNTRMRGGKRK